MRVHRNPLLALLEASPDIYLILIMPGAAAVLPLTVVPVKRAVGGWEFVPEAEVRLVRIFSRDEVVVGDS